MPTPAAIVAHTADTLRVQFYKQIWVPRGFRRDFGAKGSILGQSHDCPVRPYPGRTQSASIIQITLPPTRRAGQFTVRVIMANGDTLFKPGMFAHVRLETDRNQERYGSSARGQYNAASVYWSRWAETVRQDTAVVPGVERSQLRQLARGASSRARWW